MANTDMQQMYNMLNATKTYSAELGKEFKNVQRAGQACAEALGREDNAEKALIQLATALAEIGALKKKCDAVAEAIEKKIKDIGVITDM